VKDPLLFLAFLAAWFLLQRWLLPRFGVPTRAVPDPAGRRDRKSRDETHDGPQSDATTAGPASHASRKEIP
jgi:hypothetical protein